MLIEQRNTPVNFIKNMDFSYQLHAGRGYVDFTVTAVAGHLTSTDFEDQYKKWYSCDPFALFDAPIKTFTSRVGLDSYAFSPQEDFTHIAHILILHSG